MVLSAAVPFSSNTVRARPNGSTAASSGCRPSISSRILDSRNGNRVAVRGVVPSKVHPAFGAE